MVSVLFTWSFLVGGASIALLRDDASADREARTTRIVQAPTPSVDSTPASVVAPAAQVPNGGLSTDQTHAPASSRELALAGGSIGDLSDGELSALVEDLESLDAVPSAEVEGTQPLSLNAQEES